jgi:hypothetical protein
MVTRSSSCKKRSVKTKPRNVDAVDEFLLSLPIGQALVKQMMVEMIMGLAKKPETPEPTMSIIEWMEKMEEAEQQSSLLKRRATPHAPESV